MTVKSILFKLNNISIENAIEDIRVGLEDVIRYLTHGMMFENLYELK